MKKTTKKKKIAAKPSKVIKKTPARKTTVPKAIIPVRKEITREMVAKRAYEIFLSGRGGDELHNWLTAEHELRSA
jgi:hypothetical protein